MPKEYTLSPEDEEALAAQMSQIFDARAGQLERQEAAEARPGAGVVGTEDLTDEDILGLEQQMQEINRDSLMDRLQQQEATGEDVGRVAMEGATMGTMHNIEGVMGGAQNVMAQAENPAKGVMGVFTGGESAEDFGEGFTEARQRSIDEYEIARGRMGDAPALALEVLTGLGTSGAHGLIRGGIRTISKFAGREVADEIVNRAGKEVSEGIFERAAKKMEKLKDKGTQKKIGKKLGGGAAYGAAQSKEDDLEGIALESLLMGGFSGGYDASTELGKIIKDAVAESKVAKAIGSGYKGLQDWKRSLLSKMTQIPDEEILRYAEAPFRRTKQLKKQFGVKSEDDMAYEVSKVIGDRLEAMKKSTAEDMKKVVDANFQDDPVSPDLKNRLIKAFKAQYQDLNPDADSTKAIRQQMLKFEKMLTDKQRKLIGEENGVKIYSKPRQVKMKDLMTLWEEAKDQVSYEHLISGEVAKKSGPFQRAIRSVLYGDEGQTSIRSVLSETAPAIDKPLKKYKELHDLRQKMNKNLLVPTRSKTALREAGSKPGKASPSGEAIEKIDKILGTTETPQAASKLVEDFQMYRFFDDPDIAAFSTGRSLFAPVMGAYLGSQYGPEGIGTGGAMGIAAALSSPRLLKYWLDTKKITKAGAKALAERVGEGGGPTVVKAQAMRELNRYLGEE